MSGLSDTVEEVWQRNLEADTLQIPRCSDCQTWVWYPADYCPACTSENVRWQKVAPTGRLFSWTTVHRSFTGAPGDAPPFVIGLVEPDETTGVRLVCRQIAGDRLPAIGDHVTLGALEKDDARCWSFRLSD